ncbi:MAG: sugar phosphate isomerase/epimerase family protein, partial [Terriglobia bacterium]
MSQIGRRNFLWSSALGLAGLGAAGAQWTERLFGDPLGLPIGLQLYTVRQACEKNLSATLKRVADTGYREVELGSFDYYGLKPGDLRKLLSDHGLACTSASYSTAMLRSDWEKHIEAARELGTLYMVCASLDPTDRASIDAIHKSADLFNHCAEQSRKAGVAFAYHCHNFDFRDVGGVVGYDELLRHTDPNVVDMEMDCFWTTRAGKDPVAYFHRYPGRFALLHI